MNIRPAEKSDAPAIANIIKDHAQSDYMGYATFDEKYILDKMKRDIFLIAYQDELRSPSAHVIGCVRLSIVDADLAEIRTLCVYEKYRRAGIGMKLMEKSLEILKERNMRKVVARTKSGNSIAIKFFKKFGFEQEGYFKEHYRKGIDVIQMSKFLE